MIPFWKKAPFFRLLLPLIAGIISEYYIQMSIRTPALCFLIGIIILLIYKRISFYRRYRHNPVSGLVVHIFLFASGMVIMMCHEQRWDTRHFSNHLRDDMMLCMRLQEPPVERGKTYRVVASVTKLVIKDKVVKVNGNCYLYFKKDSTATLLDYASVIYTRSIPKSIPANDTAKFDFKRYAALQKIYHQVYLKERDYVIQGRDPSFDVYAYLYRVREHLIRIIHNYLDNPQGAAVAIALLTGYRAELDRDLSAIYQSTGTIHVIAISGMHLALIYLLLQIIFAPIDRFQRLRVCKELLILIFLWLFSLLTGAGASVIRAVIMFSFISLGKIYNKKGSIENALATSAFFMLCYNPYLLWDIGFQLSYAAVLSLVIFMQPIYRLIEIKNPLLNALWKMNAVTLSAQVLTLPLCVYHFHQLPVLFLPANVIAVPLSTLALYGLLVIAGFSFYPSLAAFTGNVVSFLIGIMNESMAYLDRFRFAVIHDLRPHFVEVVLQYVFIFSLFLFLSKKGKKYFFVACISIGCISCFRLVLFFLHKP